MTITPQVTSELFDEQTGRLIALPPRNMIRAGVPISQISMVVLTTPPQTSPGQSVSQPQLLSPCNSSNTGSPAVRNTATSSDHTEIHEQIYYNSGVPWSREEHARFQVGMELFPSGPWKAIARCVGTRTARQTMSHAQKYRQRIIRRKRIQREGRRRRQQSSIKEDNQVTKSGVNKKTDAKSAPSEEMKVAKDEVASLVVEHEAKRTDDTSAITSNSLDEAIDMLLDVHLTSDNMLEPLTSNDDLLILTDDELAVLLA